MKTKIRTLIIHLFLINLSAQTISSINPESASTGESLAVTITGLNTYFTGGGATIHWVRLVQGDIFIDATSFDVISDVLINADFDIPDNASLGFWDVSVKYDGWVDDGFNYYLVYYNPILEDGFTINLYTPVFFTRIEFYENVTPNSSNSENLINKGIPVRFKLNIQNELASNILTGYGTISSENEYVTITDSTASYNNVTSGASAWSVDEFEIIIDDLMPSGSDISFDLLIGQELNPTGPWASTFSFPVEPLMVHYTLMDDDANPDSNGDNDDVIEPNETIEVIPLLENFSTDTLYDVRGTLTSGYSFIDVWNNHSGASGIVYDSYDYNVLNNSQQPVSPGDNQIQPEFDFVFDYTADEAYEFTMNLYVTTYFGEELGQVWYQGGVRMVWASDFILNEGQQELGVDEEPIPEVFAYHQNYPNPFNPVTTLSYDLPEDAMVNITIYDMMGRVVSNLVSSQQNAGYKSIQWNATNNIGQPVSAGLYLYTIQAGKFRQTKKMVLLK